MASGAGQHHPRHCTLCPMVEAIISALIMVLMVTEAVVGIDEIETVEKAGMHERAENDLGMEVVTLAAQEVMLVTPMAPRIKGQDDRIDLGNIFLFKRILWT